MSSARLKRPRARAARPIRGFVFDVDGTLVLSDRSLGNYEPLPGAREVLSTLRDLAMPFVLLTNGSAYPPAEQAAKMRRIGLPVDDDQMLTPSSVAADLFVRRRFRRVLVLGKRGVGFALQQAGVETVYVGEHGAGEVDAVFVGWHPDCNMRDIEAAATAVWNGAKLFAASDVPFFATSAGRSIGYSFAIIGAIRRLTRATVTVTGKPSLHAMRYAARTLRLDMPSIGVVGDDPLVEVLMARRARASAIGVTTGVTTGAAWRKQPPRHRPDHVLTELRDILRLVPAARR